MDEGHSLGSLNKAYALFTCPAWAARVAREKVSDNVRAVAVIWEMHVFVNQLIECEISFKHFSIWVGVLRFYFAIWLHGTK